MPDNLDNPLTVGREEGGLTSPPATPTAGVEPRASQRPRVLWKWSLGVTAVILGLLIWQCGSGLHEGHKLSNVSVKEFHDRLNAERYEEIYQKADQGFVSAGKHDELIKLLKAVHTKLGNAGEERFAYLRVNATTGGTFIVTQYNTTFERGSAFETFTWTKSNGALKLYGYNIQSNELITN